LPVLASRQTSSPDDLAENTQSPRRSAVEVWLRILRAGAFDSGQSTFAAGFSESSWNIKPPISSRFLCATGVDTVYSLLVGSRCRHHSLPVAGSRLVTDSCVQTMSCFLPPALMTIGELNVSDSSSAFQTSLPVSLLSAMTAALGLPPVNRIRRSPSISG